MADKQLYSYADVIIDPADPRVEIGKEYYFSDVPGDVISKALKDDYARKLIGISKKIGNPLPFMLENNDWAWACLIRKKEQKYVPFDLSKPEVRDRLRGKWIRRKPYTSNPNYCREVPIDCFEQVDEGAEGIDSIYWTANGINSHELFEDWTFLDGTPCGEEVSE